MGCVQTEPEPEVSSNLEISKNKEYLERDIVKIAAGQVNQDENKYEVMLAYIDSAGAEGADLIVLPEYIAGVFSIPLKESDPISQIAKAAQKNNIYVIVGGWEEFEEGAFKAKKNSCRSKPRVKNALLAIGKIKRSWHLFSRA